MDLRASLLGLGSLTLAFASGCFAYTIDTPRPPPVNAQAAVPSDAAEVCVVRTSSAGGVQVVHDNGQLVGGTMGQGYFCYGARPGPHRVVAHAGVTSVSLELALAGGERAFLRQSYSLEDLELVRLAEPAARALLPRFHFQRLVEAPEPVLPPSSLAAAALMTASPPEPSPTSPQPRRSTGVAYGLAVGLGAAASRSALAAETTAGLAALGSVWVGVSARDRAVIAVRADVTAAGGASAADVALHLALFPAAGRTGPLRDFVVFADGGLRPPTGGASHLAGIGRLGLGLETWRLGPATVGPFLGADVARGEGQAETAVLGGLSASFYPKAK